MKIQSETYLNKINIICINIVTGNEINKKVTSKWVKFIYHIHITKSQTYIFIGEQAFPQGLLQ